MTTLDIFNAPVSVVADGLEGKALLIYGSNSLGKSFQATRFNKPLYLGFEMGLNAIAGVKFMSINKWSDFKKVNKQLTTPSNLAKVKEMYQTIVFDEVYASARMCQKYICDKYGASDISEQAPQGVKRPNLYTAYEAEYWEEIQKLLKAGLSIVFIGHEAVDNATQQIIPKGDKRSMQVIRDNADVCLYLRSNGIGEDGRPIYSSAYTAETPEFFARSRFTEITPVIPEFTAENVEKALTEAIRLDAEKQGHKTVSFEERSELMETVNINIDDAKEEAQTICGELAEAGFVAEAVELMNKHLGQGNKISEVLPRQAEALSVLLDDLREMKADKLS